MKKKVFAVILTPILALLFVACGHKSLSGTDRTGINNSATVIRENEELVQEVPESTVETYAFEGLPEKYHEGMTKACEEIKADKENIRNFAAKGSTGDIDSYSFEYNKTRFVVDFDSNNIVTHVYTGPDKIEIYKDGYEGLNIEEFCVQEESIENLKEALVKSFEAGVDISEFDLTYNWESCSIERVYDYYVVRVDGLASYKVNERRTEPKIRCDLIKNDNTYSVLYISVQNGDRINEYGKIQIPELSMVKK